MMCSAACLLRWSFGSLLVNSDSGSGCATTGSDSARICAATGSATSASSAAAKAKRMERVIDSP